MIRRFGKWLTVTWDCERLGLQCNDERVANIDYARLQAVGDQWKSPRSLSTSRRGQLSCIVSRHDSVIELFRVKPTRRACGQDATKGMLKYMTKTLWIWGYEHFSKVCSNFSFKGSRLEFKSASIWTVCKFGNRLKQRANSTRTALAEYSPMNMSR